MKKARARARRIEKAWWIEALVPADAIERVLG